MARKESVTAGPALVIAPLSTIGAWERELAKWAPGLAVLPYIGGQAARETIQRSASSDTHCSRGGVCFRYVRT